jgi:hypothetical protein
MIFVQQGIRRSEHEHGPMHPDNRLLHPDQTGVEYITHYNDNACDDDHEERQPGNKLAGRMAYAINRFLRIAQWATPNAARKSE